MARRARRHFRCQLHHDGVLLMPAGWQKRFAFLSDPVFWIGCGGYGLNRLLLKPLFPHNPVVMGYLNDLFLVPCALPVLLWIYGELGVRKNGAPVGLGELCFHVAQWALFFEWLAPRFFGVGRGDWFDVATYAAGGFLAWCGWNNFPNKSRGENRAIATSAQFLDPKV